MAWHGTAHHLSQRIQKRSRSTPASKAAGALSPLCWHDTHAAGLQESGPDAQLVCGGALPCGPAQPKPCVLQLVADADADVDAACMHAMLQVGLLSSQTRLVRIKNVLTEQQDTVEVPTEETLLQVRRQKPSRLQQHQSSSGSSSHMSAEACPGTAY